MSTHEDQLFAEVIASEREAGIGAGDTCWPRRYRPRDKGLHRVEVIDTEVRHGVFASRR